jgi:hypothetical protein
MQQSSCKPKNHTAVLTGKILCLCLLFVFVLLLWNCKSGTPSTGTASPFIDSVAKSKEKVNVLVDSLRTILAGSEEDSVRVDLILKMADEYMSTDPAQARLLAEQMLKYAVNKGYRRCINESWYQIARVFLVTSNLDSAEYWLKKSLALAR